MMADGFPEWIECLDLPDPMKPGEVAEVLHVGVKTVARWGATGRMPCFYTPGGHRRFHPRDVREILARREEKRRDPREGRP